MRIISCGARATDRILRTAEAKALADSGVHYTAALISNTNSFTSVLNGNPYDNPSVFQGITLTEASNAKRQGRFSIVGLDYNTLVAGERLQRRCRST